MKMNHNSLIPCQEQWMLLIQECQHLEANRNRRRISISTNSLLRREVLLELPTLTRALILRGLLKPRLLTLIDFRFRDQVQLSSRAMITNIRKVPLMHTRKVESR